MSGVGCLLWLVDVRSTPVGCLSVDQVFDRNIFYFLSVVFVLFLPADLALLYSADMAFMESLILAQDERWRRA